MAEETQDQEAGQKQAQDKVNVPGDVTTNNGEDTEQILADYNKHKSDESQSFFKGFGVSSKAQFVDLVASNPLVARQVAEYVVDSQFGDAKEFNLAGAVRDMQAPQEFNITGVVDHSKETPTKVHIEGESESPAVVEGVDGAVVK